MTDSEVINFPFTDDESARMIRCGVKVIETIMDAFPEAKGAHGSDCRGTCARDNLLRMRVLLSLTDTLRYKSGVAHIAENTVAGRFDLNPSDIIGGAP